MANGITNPANKNYDFGLEFNYNNWTADSVITLSNVPWNNDYRDVVSFDTTDQLNAYIDQRAAENVSITSMYAKANEPINVDAPFNKVNRYNYIRVYNPAQPIFGGDTPRYFYYFILDVIYVAPNTTQIVVQLDVWQSYIRLTQFGRCYIESGHIGIANENNFVNNGRDYLTVPEGMDVGSDYVNIGRRAVDVMSVDTGKHDVLVASTLKLEAFPGTKENPNIVSAQGSKFAGLPSGASYYIWPSSDSFLAFMKDRENAPWVTQGIISVTMIPKVNRYNAFTYGQLPIGASYAPAWTLFPRRYNMWKDWRDAASLLSYIPERYRGLRKLFTFPYMAIELTTHTGTPIIIRPEMWNAPDASIFEMVTFIPPNQRMVFGPMGYNAPAPIRASNSPNTNTIDGEQWERQNDEFLDLTTQISGFPSMAVVNDGAILYMAQTANSRAYSYQSADWSQSRAIRGNQNSYDQASAGIAAGMDSTNTGIVADAASTGVSNQLARDQTLLQGIGGVASGVGMGAFAGPAGAIAGGVGALGSGIMGALSTNNQINASNEQFAVRNVSALGQNAISSRQAGYIRDTNKGLADWAAKGDYENAIAGINARVQDAQLTPPSTAGQTGGETMLIANYTMNVEARWKMIDQNAMAIIGEHWLRYGYAVRRYGFLPQNLMVMAKFTYWKLAECAIRVAPMPEAFKQIIRGIMEKGVTVWSDPEDIGVTDPALNAPLSGIVIDGYTPPPLYDPEVITPVPEAPKRKKRKMILFTSNDGTEIWALAGSSPGNDANWLETRSATLAADFADAAGVASGIALPIAEFNAYKAQYLAPLVTVAAVA